MRGIVFWLCLAALVAIVANAAMADIDGRCFLQFKAGWYDGDTTTSNATASFGAATVPGTSMAALAHGTYNIATTDGVSTHWIANKMAADPSGNYGFRLVVAPGTSVMEHAGPHEGQVYISAWNLDFWAGTAGYTIPINWTVNVYGSRIVGGPITWAAADLYRASAPGITTVGNVGFWYQYSGHYETWGDAIAADEIFYVTTNWGSPPPLPAAPEPTSLLALGSSLVGLAGFAMRRRKA